MNYRRLGRTGLNVSRLSLGTVELGMPYGVGEVGNCTPPSSAEAVRLVQMAADAGINLFDTAPNYGDSESLVGKALEGRKECWIATKVSIPREADGTLARGKAVRAFVRESLEFSLKKLRRETLDIVQIHNATVEVLQQGEMQEALCEAVKQGSLRFIGASVYREDEALAAIDTDIIDVLQVACNVLDQRMVERVFPSAQRKGVGLITRSSLLKGALTPRAECLPETLGELRRATICVRDVLAGGDWAKLPAQALRFALSVPGVASVLIGVREQVELDGALAAAALAPLSSEAFTSARQLGLSDDALLNPSRWPIP